MLEVQRIDVHYNGIQALWGVSLHVGKGELVSLIGSNGAGKSTVVETISGLLSPAAGSILFNGVRLDRIPAHQVVELGISLIPEERGVFPGMTVLENLELGAFTHESRRHRHETLSSVYDLFPVLMRRKGQKAGTMSGGEQQMLAVGRALMSMPKMLMCDEPSLGLAPIVVKSIFKAIRQINQTGVGILLVEQNVKAALGLSRRAYIIENGRIAGEGESKDLLNDEKVREAYLGAG
ncbi:MAG: ABC transporter ATP-binding protein [Thermodesulfobacteriota bacterium]